MAKRFDYFREGGLDLKNSKSESKAPKNVEKHLDSTESENAKQAQGGEEQTGSVVDALKLEPSEVYSVQKESLEKEEIKVEEKSQNQEQTVDNSSKNIEVVENTQAERIYTWEAFSEWLMEKSPALSSTIEQGEFTQNPIFECDENPI